MVRSKPLPEQGTDGKDVYRQENSQLNQIADDIPPPTPLGEICFCLWQIGCRRQFTFHVAILSLKRESGQIPILWRSIKTGIFTANSQVRVTLAISDVLETSQ